MRRPALIASLLLVAGALSVRAAAGPLVFKTVGKPVRLLEVYSSEGCSSCPPADAWVGQMASDTALWTSVVPMVWHVDYWDRLGWRDALASRNNSLRQKAEASAAGTTTYTPGFFLNGAEWRGFFDANPLPPQEGADPGLLRVTQTAPREFIVAFTPTGDYSRPMDLCGAFLGMNVSVRPTAGENRGQALTHDFVVLGAVTRRVDAHNGTYTVRMTLDNFTSVNPDRKAAAFWVAPAGGYAALQATGGFLPEELPDEP